MSRNSNTVGFVFFVFLGGGWQPHASICLRIFFVFSLVGLERNSSLLDSFKRNSSLLDIFLLILSWGLAQMEALPFA